MRLNDLIGSFFLLKEKHMQIHSSSGKAVCQAIQKIITKNK